MGCEKAAHDVMTIRATGTLRCFVNNTLVGEGEETVKVNAAFKSGMNAVLVKSWNNKGSLRV